MAYIDTTNMPLHMPVPGTREPAQIALLNENCVVIDAHDHTTGKGLAMGRLRSGLAANRPAASTAGNVYFSTDTGVFNVDTGTAWVQFLTSGGQATVTGWTLIDPIIRDTLQWGPEGSGTIDGTITRSAAGVWDFAGTGTKAWVTMRATGASGSARFGQPVATYGTPSHATAGYWLSANADFDGTNWTRDDTGIPSSHLSMVEGTFTVYSIAAGTGNITWGNPRFQLSLQGSAGLLTTLPNDIHPARIGLRISDAGWLMGGSGYNALEIRCNSYQNTSNLPTAFTTNAAGSLALVNDALSFSNAASVAAGAQQTFVNRFNIAADGSVTINGTAGTTTRTYMLGVRPSFELLNSGGGPGRIRLSAVYGTGYGYLTANLGYDGSNWNLDDTNQNGVGVNFGGSGTDAFQVYSYPSGANPATSRARILFNVNYNGTTFITADAGYGALILQARGQTYSHGAQASYNGNTPEMCWVLGTYGPYLGQSHTNLRPLIDTAITLGDATHRFYTLYCWAAPVVGSLAANKHDFSRLDPSACAQAVLDTDWLDYFYNDPPPPPQQEAKDGETDEERQQREAANAELVRHHEEQIAVNASASHQKGYALGSPEYKVADLFGQDDRESKSDSSDLAVVACALQDALRRLAALEARNATAA